jgi:hypothetical protein
MAAPYPEIASGKPLLRQKRARDRSSTVPCAPARAITARSRAGTKSAATSDHDCSRAAARRPPPPTFRIATVASNCWRHCSVCFPFSGNCSPTALSRAGLSRCHGRHPAPPRNRDRQAIQSGQGLRRPAQALGGQTHHPWLNRCPRLAKDWENLNRNALAFLKLASIRLMLRKLCNPS